jgi:di/tricarboxylate transporter
MVLQTLKIGISLLALVLGMCMVISPPDILSSSESIVAGLILVVITFWVTGIIAEYQTAMLFFMLSMILSVASVPVVFSGFSSAAFWLVFGGFVLGIDINETGLGKRIAEK